MPFDLDNWERIYNRRGLPFRWRRAVLSLQGTQYVEVVQTLDGRPMSVARCMVWDTSEHVEDAPFGWRVERATMFSCLPHQVELALGDQVLIQSPVLKRDQVIKEGATVELAIQPVHSILSITTEALAVVPSSAYTVTTTGLTWGVGAPSDGVSLSIDYRSTGWCEWKPEGKGAYHLGSDGRKLPQRGRIERISAQ